MLSHEQTVALPPSYLERLVILLSLLFLPHSDHLHALLLALYLERASTLRVTLLLVLPIVDERDVLGTDDAVKWHRYRGQAWWRRNVQKLRERVGAV